MIALISEVARAADREIADFLGHHGEPTSRLAGTRGLDRGVQRQEIGALGDRTIVLTIVVMSFVRLPISRITEADCPSTRGGGRCPGSILHDGATFLGIARHASLTSAARRPRSATALMERSICPAVVAAAAALS